MVRNSSRSLSVTERLRVLWRRLGSRAVIAAVFPVFALLILMAHLVFHVGRTGPPAVSECHRHLAAAVHQNKTLPWLDAKGYYRYWLLQKPLESRLDAHIAAHMKELNRTRMEGHTGKRPMQQRVYAALASNPCVQHVCETGFNAGHSATVWLTSKPSITLSAFDVAQHAYLKEAVRFIQDAAPGRVRLALGDSLHTVPKASYEKQLPCDLLVVDGGHDFRSAMADIINFRGLAEKRFNIFIIDDVYCDKAWCRGPTDALDVAVKQGLVKVLQTWSTFNGTRGFAVGYFPL